MKFRKKPVVIEAFEVTDEVWSEIMDLAYPDHNGEYPVSSCWLQENLPDWFNNLDAPWSISSSGKSLLIQTLEGTMEVSIGDYIIQGVHGELYPCKPEIFEKTYEPV